MSLVLRNYIKSREEINKSLDRLLGIDMIKKIKGTYFVLSKDGRSLGKYKDKKKAVKKQQEVEFYKSRSKR